MSFLAPAEEQDKPSPQGGFSAPESDLDTVPSQGFTAPTADREAHITSIADPVAHAIQNPDDYESAFEAEKRKNARPAGEKWKDAGKAILDPNLWLSGVTGAAKFVGGIVGTPLHTAAQMGATVAAPIARAAGADNAANWMENEQLTQGAEAVLAAQQAEQAGRHVVGQLQRIPGMIGETVMGAAGMQETASPKALDFNDRAAFDEKIKAAKQAQSIASGIPLDTGTVAAMSRAATGMDPSKAFGPEVIAAQGARQPSALAVEMMGSAVNPVNVALPFVDKIPGARSVAGGITQGIGKLAQVPERLIPNLPGKLGKFGRMAETVAEPMTTGKALAAGAAGVTAGTWAYRHPEEAAALAGVIAASKGLAWMGRGIESSGLAMRTGTSDLIKEGAVARLTGQSAKANTAQRFIGDSVGAGVGTAVGFAPFNAAIADDPKGFVESEVNAGMMGATFAAFHSSRPQLVEAGRPYLRMRGEQSIDANSPEGRRSSQILMQMPEAQRNTAFELLGTLGNLPVRNGAGELVPATMLFQTGSEYANTVNRITEAEYKSIDRKNIYNSTDKGARKAARKQLVTAALNRINAAKTRGFAWIDGKAYINTDAPSFSRPGEAGHVMGHEFGGHIAMRMLHAAGEKGGQIYEGLMSQMKRGLITPKGTPTEKYKAFINEYNRRMGSKQQNPYDANSQEEFLAETAGKIIAEGGIADAAMPKGLLDHITNATGQFFAKFIGLDTGKTKSKTGLNIDEVGAITNEVRDTLAQLAGMNIREGQGLQNPPQTADQRAQELNEILARPRPPGTAPAEDVKAWQQEQQDARKELGQLGTAATPFPAAGAPPVAPSAPAAPKTPADIQRFNDAKAALMALGHKAGEAITAIREAEKQHGKAIETTENLVKGAQRILQKLTVAPGQYEAGYVKPVAPLPEVDTTKTVKNVDGNQVKITGESTDPVKVGDFVLTEGGNVRKVLSIDKDGRLNLNYPQSGDGRPTEIANPGRYRVLTTEVAPQAAAAAETPQNTVKPGPGGTFIIVDAAGNPINKRTYKTQSMAERVAAGQGRRAKFRIPENPNPEMPDIIDAILEATRGDGIYIKGMSVEEKDGLIPNRGNLRKVLSGENPKNTWDEVARLLSQTEEGAETGTRAFIDSADINPLESLSQQIHQAYAARERGENAESAAAKAEADAIERAAKQPTQPQSQPPQNATSPADTQTSESVPPSTNVATAEPPARDAAPESGSLSRLQIDAIADEARESFLSDKAPAKSGANKGQHTKANQQAADKAAFQAVAQAHAAAIPPNYEGIKLTESPLGFPEVSGTVKPGRAFDDYLLELAGITPDQLQTIADIQSRIGQTISVQYAHAAGKPGEPNYAATRKAAQAKSPAKGRQARGEGQEETKVFLPQKLKFNFGAKTFTVLGTNVEKLLGNFGWAEEAMQQAGEEMPYRDIHDPKLVADLKGLQANHDAGFTWDGNPIQGLVDRPQATNRPSADKAPYEGFLDEEGMPDLHRFEFLNLLLGNEGARTGKRGPTDIQKAKLTLGEMNRGDVSDPVTAEGETNQLRDRLNAALGPQEVLDADGNPTGETDRWSKVFMEDPLDEALSIENVTRINPEVERGTSPLHENDYRGDIDRHFGKLKPSNTEQERIAAAGRFLPEEAGAENASDAVKKRAAQLWKEKGTDSPFFKKWFGDSKVVDDQGNPQKMYHGTADEFTEFDLDHPNRKDTGWLGTGVYLTDSPDIARSYSLLKGGKQPRTMELFAKLENPYFATTREKQRIQLISHSKGAEAGREASDAWTRELKSKGHDGVILRFPASEVGTKNASQEVVVFDTAGVKSATINEGTFDPKNPDIRFLPEEKPESRRSPKEMAQERIAKRAGKFMPEDARDIVPAIKINGKLVKGEKGDTHKDILDRHLDANPDDSDALFDFDTKANPNLFVGPDGQEISREQLKERFGVVDSQGLRRLQDGGKFMPEDRDTRRGILDPEYIVRQIDAKEAKALDSEQGAWWLFTREDDGSESEVIAVAEGYVPKNVAIKMAIEQSKKYGDTKIGRIEEGTAPKSLEQELARLGLETRRDGNNVYVYGQDGRRVYSLDADPDLVRRGDNDTMGPRMATEEETRAIIALRVAEGGRPDTRPSSPATGEPAPRFTVEQAGNHSFDVMEYPAGGRARTIDTFASRSMAELRAQRLNENPSSIPPAPRAEPRTSMPRLPQPSRPLAKNSPLADVHQDLDAKIVEQQSSIEQEIKTLTEQIDEYGQTTGSNDDVEVRTQRAELEEFRRSLVEDHANLHSLRESLRLANPSTLDQFPRAFAEIRRLEVRGLISHEAKEAAYDALSDRQNTEIARQIIAEEEARPERERQSRIDAKIRVAQREAQQARTEQQTLWDDLLQKKDAKNLPKIARLWQQVSRNDDAFTFPRSKATDPADIAKEMSTAKSPITGGTGQRGNMVQFSSGNGVIHIVDVNDRPEISAPGAGSRGKKGGGGSQLYQAAFAWAHNNGKVIHPSNALSTINAYVRRTSNMLSSALRFGTTRHMIPDNAQGVKNWQTTNSAKIENPSDLGIYEGNLGWSIAKDDDGNGWTGEIYTTKQEAEKALKKIKPSSEITKKQTDADANNIAQLAMRESEQVMKAVPSLAALDFDFKTGKIKDRNGKEITPPELGKLLEAEGKANTYDRGIGLSTAQRAIITASALREAEGGTLAGTDRGRGNRLVKEQRNLLYLPEDNGHPDAIKEAAIRMHDTGKVYTGHSHGGAMGNAEDRYPGIWNENGPTFDEGFVTKGGTFLSREQALAHARRIGQVSKKEAVGLNARPEAMESSRFYGAARFLPESPANGKQNPKEAARERQRERQHSVHIGNARLTPKATNVTIPRYLPESLHHGTPHEVDKFTTEKIGTGEGAQVYGWGLYFAENKAVADQYAKTLSQDRTIFVDRAKGHGEQSERIRLRVQEAVLKEGANRIDAQMIAQATIALAAMDQSAPTPLAIAEMLRYGKTPEKLAHLKAAADVIQQYDIQGATGKVYSVRVKPEAEEFLDWDKPMKEQSEKVRRAIIEHEDGDQNAFKHWSGREIYDHYSQGRDGAKKASEKLASLGIAGIRFLDQGSRIEIKSPEYKGAAWEASKDGKLVAKDHDKSRFDAAVEKLQTRNYVIFRDDDIEITHRNGEPVTPAERRQAMSGQFMPDSKSTDSRSPAPRQRAFAVKIVAKDRLEPKKDAAAQINAIEAKTIKPADLGLPYEDRKLINGPEQTLHTEIPVSSLKLGREDLNKTRLLAANRLFQTENFKTKGVSEIHVMPSTEKGKYVVAANGNHRAAILLLTQPGARIPVTLTRRREPLP